MIKHKVKKNMKIVRETDTHIIEYDIRLMIYRCLVLIFVLSFLIFVGYRIFALDEEKDNERIGEVEKYDSNFRDLNIVEDKSYGDFKSLDDSIVVQGSLKVVLDKNRQYVEFDDFKVTNNKFLVPALSTNVSARSVIFLADKLLGSVGKQRYEIPTNVDLNSHRYFIFWSSQKNKSVVYAELD